MVFVWDYSLPIYLINIILSIRPLKSCPCLGLLYVLFRAEEDVSIKIFLNIFYFLSIELFLTPPVLSDNAWRKQGQVWPPSPGGEGRRRLPRVATVFRWSSRSRSRSSSCSATYTMPPLTTPSSNTASPNHSQTSTLVSSDVLIISL